VPHLRKDPHALRCGADEHALPLRHHELHFVSCATLVTTDASFPWCLSPSENGHPMLGDVTTGSGAFTLGRSVRSLMGPGLLSHECSAKIQLSDASIDAEFLPSLRCQLTRSQLGDNVKRLDAHAIPFTNCILAWKDM
jgi:hypothetical protein